MKRLTRILLRLYPPAWRSRYRDELEALIEDSGSSWRAIPDLLKEAVRMQFTTWSFGKLAVVLGVTGLIVAALTSAFIPTTYASGAELRITRPAGSSDVSPSVANQQVIEHLMRMEAQILSRTSLAEIIRDPRLDLYSSERESTPLEDVIEKMRRDGIRIYVDSPSTFDISFRYPDKVTAQQTVQALLFKLADANQAQNAAIDYPRDHLRVLDFPTLPTSPRVPFLLVDWKDLLTVPAWLKPTWLALATAALLAGSAKRFLRRWPFGKKIGMAGIVGLAAAWLIFPLIPLQFVSQAELQMVAADNSNAAGSRRQLTEKIMRIQDDVLSRSSLSGIIQDPRLDLYLQERKSAPLADVIDKMRRQDVRIRIDLPAESPWPTVNISFRYPDRLKAQQTLYALVTRFRDADTTERRQETARKSPPPPIQFAGFNLDVLAPPSPAGPAKPNRWFFASLGICAGIMLAAQTRLFLKLRYA